MENQKINRAELHNFFAGFAEIKAVYLFGSHAVQKEGKLSDLDLAVLLDEDDKGNHSENAAGIKLKLLKGLTELGYDNIDLMVLNRLSLLGKYEAVKHNEIMYSADDFDKDSYFSYIIRRYLDFRPMLDVQKEYLRERIMNG